MIKLVIYGHTGSGKSTSASMIRDYFEVKGLSVAIIKLAQPLYEIQQEIYKKSGRPIEFYEQDQLLLEAVASHLRRIEPKSLVNNFIFRLNQTNANVVINDDFRDPYVDYPELLNNGFKFIRITCNDQIRNDRLQKRGDLTTKVNSSTTADIDWVKPDAVIDNSFSNLNDLENKIIEVLEELQ